jgi:hypothetical protein
MNAVIERIVMREPTAVVKRHGLHGKVSVLVEPRFRRVNKLVFEVRLSEHASEGHSIQYLKPPEPNSSTDEVFAAADRQAKTIVAKVAPEMYLGGIRHAS